MIETILLYVGLKQLKTITFSDDTVLINGLFGKSSSFGVKEDKIRLWFVGRSMYAARNSVAVFSGNKKLANFKLNDHEWELEEFYHQTVSCGYKWKISEDLQPAHAKNYELFLKRKK